MKISVVIPTHNRKDKLKKLIMSLLKQKFPKKDYEIIVVSDSSDGTEEMINQLIKKSVVKVKCFRKKSDGPSQKRNMGIKNAKGKIVAFVDDDCIADENWLKNIYKCFSNDVGGVEGKTVTEKNKGPFSHYIVNERGGEYMTCNMAYKKDLLDNIGGFDERFTTPITINREDSDLAFSVLEMGHSIRFSKEAIIKHPLVKTSFINRMKKKREFFIDPLLFKKHPKLYNERIKFPFEMFTPIYLLVSLFSIFYPYLSIFLFFTAFIEIKYRSWNSEPIEFLKFVLLQTIGSFVIVAFYIYGCFIFKLNPIKPILHA